EDQNPLRRSEIFAGSRSATLALTEAIKSLSNVSGREGDIYLSDSYKVIAIKRNPQRLSGVISFVNNLIRR
ncbi:hypothetical protein, partial [Yersinia enterocolitica]|uniref:hypothetical protein n=1 Tax=Yersinia enterocolitica TaxID=630 RepID=UPI003F433053